jgi:hypothetical protein
VASPWQKTVSPFPAEGLQILGGWPAGVMLYIMGFFQKNMYNIIKGVGKKGRCPPSRKGK